MSVQVKCFDEEHELDLESVVNEFLKTLPYQSVIDIKYSISHIFISNPAIFLIK